MVASCNLKVGRLSTVLLRTNLLAFPIYSQALLLFLRLSSQRTHIFYIFLESPWKSLSAMHLQDRRPIALLCGLLFYFSLILAQNTDLQTIFSLNIFSSQKPCAQNCFTGGPGYVGGCFEDLVGNAIRCVSDNHSGLGSSALAPNFCFCRSDLQKAADSSLTACVKSGCTIGHSSIDISSAGSIYDYYYKSLGTLSTAPPLPRRRACKPQQLCTLLYLAPVRIPMG